MNWLVVTAGRGPAECHIAVAGILEIQLAEAKQAGLSASVIDAETAPHGLASALVALEGDGLERFLAGWTGTIRWTCPSPLRPGKGRKNWFIGISALAPPPPGSALHEADLRFEACRASGPGGQHVNKTSSAIRATHVPTGLTAFAQEERSQHRNKALAIARIAAALLENDRRSGAAAERDRWSRHDELERGLEIRAFEGKSFRPVRTPAADPPADAAAVRRATGGA